MKLSPGQTVYYFGHLGNKFFAKFVCYWDSNYCIIKIHRGDLSPICAKISILELFGD